MPRWFSKNNNHFEKHWADWIKSHQGGGMSLQSCTPYYVYAYHVFIT